ncbi:restriction endonuclease [Christiangramia salexigens]|uniref:ATPase n=1 Tax=Christiangramia salexigens TaxID=1913577 RepID=A0A1L3J1Z3_9FLAO|nr:restriction endonuclease [Christiangramia salexigens]APG59133.1 ATPase [Christiangramia salexigens]
MDTTELDIIKSSGDRVKFSYSKLRNSLLHSGADEITVQSIIDIIRDELYQGISTKEIYNRAFALLKNAKTVYASKYKLKNAIYELGPSGFPFEQFVAEILKLSGYEVLLNQKLTGKCIDHEVDIVIYKNSERNLVECKFHSEEGRNCDVKIPLYIFSRYLDIHNSNTKADYSYGPGWVITNTRFSRDAIQYAKCMGLYLISWNYPQDNSLKDRIDRLGLYPITTSTLLSRTEKQFLLDRKIVLGNQLLKKDFLLDHQGISSKRKTKILAEFRMLCKQSKLHEE